MKSTESVPDARYKNPDKDPRGPYVLSNVTSSFDRPTLQYEWHGHFPRQGLSWRFTRERAAALEADGRIVFSTAGMPRLKRYLSEAASKKSQEPEVKASSRLEVIVRTAMKAVALEIAENPNCLREVEWRDLERVMREVFERLGFRTELTRPGKDGGFDLRLESDECGETKVFLVEVKHWLASRKKPGSKALSSLVDVVAKAGEETKGFPFHQLFVRPAWETIQMRLQSPAKSLNFCHRYLQL